MYLNGLKALISICYTRILLYPPFLPSPSEYCCIVHNCSTVCSAKCSFLSLALQESIKFTQVFVR